MIRLERSQAPAELTVEIKHHLTEKFASDSSSVWNLGYIRSALLACSHSKCAYCETRVDEESKYMEVEHFRCKAQFPHLVIEWENLLPSCKRCNTQKHAHNVETQGMIIDPFSINPRDHLYFQGYRLRWRDELGRRTVSILYLNDSDRVVAKRFAIGNAISEALEDLRELLEDYLGTDMQTRRRNRITRGVERLLSECQPAKEYSAVAATALLSDSNYFWIKERLQELELWGTLQALEDSASGAALLP